MLLRRADWSGLLREARTGGISALPATQLFLLSFAALIALGTAGLLWLPGLYTGADLGFVDALFTATSAVCVTGLIVVDTATYFTPLGQGFLAVLIQLGGLGILTFTTLLIVLLGGRVSLGAREATAGQSRVLSRMDPLRLLRSVVGVTFLAEAAGAVSLWLAWRDPMGEAEAIWPAVFHAISAFCNAGFSIFSDSMVGHRSLPLVLLSVTGLVILGGIGFVVLTDLHRRWEGEGTGRLATHSRMALTATAVLLAGAMVLYLALEWNNTLAGMGWVDRLLNGWFMAVTPRTAGFNTVNYDAVTNGSLFLTIVLMLVGGSPGSAAGGLKTTTITLLVLAFLARLRGEQHVSFGGRTIPRETVSRAAGLVLGGLVILGTAVFLLAVTEMPPEGGSGRIEFLRLVFEAHSAFGTVGLSMGTTPELSRGGRLVVTGLMYLGRVGPLAVASAMALATRNRAARYRYAHEDVVIG